MPKDYDMIIRINSERAEVEVEQRSKKGVITRKNISPQSLSSCILTSRVDDASHPTGLLPEGCIAVVMEKKYVYYYIRYPESYADFSYFGTEYPHFPIPRLVFCFKYLPSARKVAEASLCVVKDERLGVALIMMGEQGERLTSAIQSFSDVMSKITAIVMEFSPIGVCALLADSVGSYGLKIFGPLGKLILTVYASDVILVFLMYVPMVAILARFPIGQFFKGIWKVWVVTLSTTSSAGSLPITTSVTNDDFGVSPELSSFSLPLGATINMNGGCIYYAAAIVMTAQIYGMDLTPAALLNIVVSTVLVAMGCPGVPGGAIIMTTILLTNMGLPLEIVGMIAGIFRLIDMANTTFNVTGDVVTTMVVARSENMITPPAAAAAKK